MPTSVADAFTGAALERAGVVRWGNRPPTSASGVYVVALTDSPDAVAEVIPAAPLSSAVFERWLEVRPELTMDDARPPVDQLMDRVGRFWIGDETIVYVGLATSLSTRLAQYYQTPIGARRPHAGGYFLKLLSNLEKLWVHYAICSDPARSESQILKEFCAGVSDEAKTSLLDPAHPFPFANLEWPAGVRKAHGLRGVREPRESKPQSLVSAEFGRTSPTPTHRSNESREVAMGTGRGRGPHSTQRVTAADRRAGQIRIPFTSTSSAKTLFPTNKSTIDVLLRGRSVQCSWDPSMGPDRERSGVLRVGSALRDLVRDDETLSVSVGGDGLIEIV